MHVGTAEMAAILSITDRQVQSLEKQGVLAKEAHGRWAVPQNVKAYLDYRLQSEVKRAGPSVTHDHIRDLRAKELELKIEVRTEAYLKKTMGEVLDMVDEMGGALRNDVYAIPARVTTDLTLRRKIEDEIDAAFDAASKRAAAYADRCEAAERGVDGAQAADAGPVGQGQPRLPAQRRKARAA